MIYTLPIASFIVCLAATPLVQIIARKNGWMAYPTKDRWHKKPTSLLGGIAIYAGISLPLLFMVNLSELLPHIVRFSNQSPLLPSIGTVIWVGGTLIFLLGLADDFIHIKPHTKLIGQMMLASIVTFLGFRLHWVTSLTLDTTLTILWIVGITNAFNLIDNMDGLCAGTGLIAASYLVLLTPGTPDTAIVAMIIAAALGAFLIYNFHPASIFMGDCGSLLVGFTLAMLGLHYSAAGAGDRLSSITVPVMILMVPIFDTTLVTLIRTLSGRKASVGGKDHASHRLVLMGFSEKGAVLFLYGIAAISGLSALFVDRTDTISSPAVIVPLAIAVILMGIYLAQLRVYPEKEFSVLRDRAYTPILMELTYKRQILLVILDFFLVAFSYYLSYRLRFDSTEFGYYFKVFLRSLPAVIACKLVAFFILGVYRSIWRYMSVNDVFVYIKASTLASVLSITLVTFIYRFEDFSKGIFLIDWLLTTGLLIGTRGSFRLFVDTMKRKTLAGATVLIYGAGRGGEILLRELLNNKKLKLKPLGFIDDDILKIGKKLQGYPIVSSCRDLESTLNKYEIDGLLISFDNKDPGKLDAVKTICKERKLFLKQFSVHIEDVDLEAAAAPSYPAE